MTNQISNTPIHVDVDKVVETFRGDTCRCCLDLKTGTVVPADECDESSVGEGRAGVAAGRRFIRIPTIDEMVTRKGEQIIGELATNFTWAVACCITSYLSCTSAADNGARYWLGLFIMQSGVEVTDVAASEIYGLDNGAGLGL